MHRDATPPLRLCAAPLLGLFLVFVACGTDPEAHALGDPPSELAAERYAEGRKLAERRTPAALLAALEHFQAATEAEPEAAYLHAAVAEASALLGLYAALPPGETMPRAEAAARRALSLEPSLAEAHGALGLTQYLYGWDFAAAEESFQRALEHDPEYASVHHWYAMLLSASKRHPEAIAAMRLGLEADPESWILNVKLGTVLANAGQLDAAEVQLERCLARNPKSAMAHRELGFLALRRYEGGERAQLATALAAFEGAAVHSGGDAKSTAAVGHALGLLGQLDEARRRSGKLIERSASEFVPPMYVALALAGLDEPTEALDWLERAAEIRDPGLVYLGVKPGFAPLRQEPRFQRLLDQLAL